MSQAIPVQAFEHLVLSVATSGSANFTLKFQGAIEDSAPDFSSSQAVSNMWDFLQVKDLQDGSSINGDTGLSKAGSDDHRLFEVNTNLIKWLSVRITAHSAGKITVKLLQSKDV